MDSLPSSVPHKLERDAVRVRHAITHCDKVEERPTGLIALINHRARRDERSDGLDVAGSYQAVSAMKDDGTCDFSDVKYSGPIAPFDEDVRLGHSPVLYPSADLV